MRSLFFEIRTTVGKTVERSGFTVSKTLRVLGIHRSWYYRQLHFEPALEGRFNPLAARGEEWLVIGYRRRNPGMNHREIAYAMMDEDIAYLSPSSVYRILKRNGLITPWRDRLWSSKKKDKPDHPDEIWQTDIMYVRAGERFFYLIIFIDVYSRYITHYSLMTSMDGNAVSGEAQIAVEKLRKDSPAEPVIQSDNGSAFISMEFRIVLKENHLTHKRIHPHTPEQNAIVERTNRTVRDEIDMAVVLDYQDAVKIIDRIVGWYNNERRHSSLNYLRPADYYRGDPGVLLAVREAKMETARKIRRENNMNNRKGGVATGSLR